MEEILRRVLIHSRGRGRRLAEIIRQQLSRRGENSVFYGISHLYRHMPIPWKVKQTMSAIQAWKALFKIVLFIGLFLTLSSCKRQTEEAPPPTGQR